MVAFGSSCPSNSRILDSALLLVMFSVRNETTLLEGVSYFMSEEKTDVSHL